MPEMQTIDPSWVAELGPSAAAVVVCIAFLWFLGKAFDHLKARDEAVMKAIAHIAEGWQRHATEREERLISITEELRKALENNTSVLGQTIETMRAKNV